MCGYVRSLLVHFVVQGKNGVGVGVDNVDVALLLSVGGDAPSIAGTTKKNKKARSVNIRTMKGVYMGEKRLSKVKLKILTRSPS